MIQVYHMTCKQTSLHKKNSYLCRLLPIGKRYSLQKILKSLEVDVLRLLPHKEQYVSVNIWTLTPCINIILH